MKKVWKIVIVALVVAGIIGIGYLLIDLLGLKDFEGLKKLVDNTFWGTAIFCGILVLQVLFLPAGTLLFTGSAVLLFESPLKAWLVCWFSLVVGSWIMFWIARLGGTKVLKWIVGQERAEKYAYYLGRGKFVLPLILLVPIFPDDLVCFAAGLSNTNWLYFMIVIFITRGIDNFCTVFIGANMLKSTVGIILLIAFIILMVIASYFLTKHQDKIENYFLEKFTKKKKAQSGNSAQESIQQDEQSDIKENDENKK